MKTAAKITAIAIIFLAIQSCASTFELQHPKAYRKYTKMEPIKALALAKGEGGKSVWGYGSGYSSIKEAKENALYQCNGRRIVYKIDKKCEIHFLDEKDSTDPKPKDN